MDEIMQHAAPVLRLRADGARVRAFRLRPLDASDRSRIESFFERLSPESRYLRFHRASPRLSPGLLALLTAVDGKNHVAVGAFAGETLAGVSRFVRLREDAQGAEVAVSVADAFQGQGLGRRLVQALAFEAAGRGIRRFHFTIIAHNARALSLLVRPGARVRCAGPLREGEVPVTALLADAAAPRARVAQA